MSTQFEESLIEELSTISEFNNRIYPAHAPENVGTTGTPRLIFVSSYGVRTKTLDGGYGGGRRVPVELNVIDTSYLGMRELTGKVMALLEGMGGRVIGNGPFIQELTYYDPQEFYENEPNLHRCLIDFEVFFEEDE
jgi:hypothetical protein